MVSDVYGWWHLQWLLTDLHFQLVTLFILLQHSTGYSDPVFSGCIKNKTKTKQTNKQTNKKPKQNQKKNKQKKTKKPNPQNVSSRAKVDLQSLVLGSVPFVLALDLWAVKWGQSCRMDAGVWSDRSQVRVLCAVKRGQSCRMDAGVWSDRSQVRVLCAVKWGQSCRMYAGVWSDRS